jgi:hypothetical protein
MFLGGLTVRGKALTLGLIDVGDTTGSWLEQSRTPILTRCNRHHPLCRLNVMSGAPRPWRYEHLTPSEAEHFLTHGWLKVPGAIKPEYISSWMSDLWVRLGYDPADKSTWSSEYYHMPHHRQVRAELVAPRAWGKIVDICGGEERIDPERERWIGDNFIINFGTRSRAESDPRDDVPLHEKGGFHCDNDWYRMFLDSSSTALTIVYCFTDIPARGGGTILCEDGIEGGSGGSGWLQQETDSCGVRRVAWPHGYMAEWQHGLGSR